MSSTHTHNFDYDPSLLPRELKKHYISASNEEIQLMLQAIGEDKLDDLFSHIPKDVHFDQDFKFEPEMDYFELGNLLEEISHKNNVKTSFIGSGLPQYKIMDIVPYVCNLRGLTTAYTPYQPERSQGTLRTLWIYQSLISKLTGFEAINASLYDRSTCLFEALGTAKRLVRGSSKVIVCESIYPGDIEVLETLKEHTKLEIIYAPLDKNTGLTDISKLIGLLETHSEGLAAVAFPQINTLGLLEKVDELTDLCKKNNIKSIAIIDPMTLGTGGLKPPSEFGSDGSGSDMIVGEGQHLCLAANFGGPGLGIFGIRYNPKQKNSIRSSAGRFVGKARDASGEEAFCMVLSTREQHIRRERATSNICSNQSFVATLAGAALLERGELGLKSTIECSRSHATKMLSRLCSFEGVEPRFAGGHFFNEFVLKLPMKACDFISRAADCGVHAGVNAAKGLRSDEDNLIQLFFSDLHSADDLDALEKVFNSLFKKIDKKVSATDIPAELLRSGPAGLKDFSRDKIKHYYTQMSEQNISPDQGIYPLGSCTMKYNPHINDWAASLKGFTDIHPEAPLEDCQGALEIIYHTQNQFCQITGLPALTTQPMAGAQGELVGLKMIQAYHHDNGEGEKRNIVLIPRSAHGTNPATATMAGFETKKVGDQVYGIVTIEACEQGLMDFSQLEETVKKHGPHIAGIMVTNPNTAGIFESQFKQMGQLIHDAGGLVYMDGANMNAIAGWVDLGKLGVDAVHNNQHKTWTIPHGGGGPGDAIVAVSEKLIDYLPGHQVVKDESGVYSIVKPKKSIGSVHRHFGNFAHKVRAYSYVKRLGREGIKKMSAIAVLSARYLFEKLKSSYPTLPVGADDTKRMHEFILTLTDEEFKKLENAGVKKSEAIAKLGKLFLDFGLHAPTVAFPEVFGIMIEPTESFTLSEIDRFCEVVVAIKKLVDQNPEVCLTTPHFTPVRKVDEVWANKNLCFSEDIDQLVELKLGSYSPSELSRMPIGAIVEKIISVHGA